MRGEIVAYVGGVADRAILTYRGMPMRDITPDRFQTLFGNGYAVTREFLEENRDGVEGIGRAMVRATPLTRYPAKRATVVEHIQPHCGRGARRAMGGQAV